MRPVAVAEPTRAELAAASWAALAEAAAACLPAEVVLVGGAGIHLSPLAFAPLFLAVVVGSVFTVCRFRGSPRVAAVAGGVALALGVAIGRGGARHEVVVVLVCLLIAVRIVMLGFRDWGEPIGASFAAGASVILAEAVVGVTSTQDWAPPLALLIPVFFLASMASRAYSVWSVGDALDVAEADRHRWLRRAVAITWWIPVAMLAAVGLGVRSGALDRVGSLLAPIGDALVSAFAFLASQIARPFLWLVDRLGIDPNGVRRLFERVGQRAGRARDHALRHVGHPSLLGRLLGLALFVGAALLVVRVIRRLRPDVGTTPSRSERARVATSVEPIDPVLEDEPTGRTDELPADRVRRWYAEVLLALARRGVRKEPALTPAEFAPIVAAAYPESERSFHELTRAYQDVRYGALRFDEPTLHRLKEHRRTVLGAVRRRAPDQAG